MTTSHTAPAATQAPLDVAAVRRDFPALDQLVHGKPLVYLDSAASTLKPRAVIDAIAGYYASDHANVHRAVHELATRATDRYEHARATVAAFIKAPSDRQVVFTAGNTLALNTAAHGIAQTHLRPGDRVLVTTMEHHSGIVPWQMAAQRAGAEVVPVPLTAEGRIDLDALDHLLDGRAKVLSTVWISNVLGTINPIAELARRAHDRGCLLVVDGAQAIPHAEVDVQTLDIDVLTLAGHKALGPTGIGALYARAELLEAMPPLLGGGEMIDNVSFQGTTYAAPPARFEAGTPNIGGAVGFAAALDYINTLGAGAIRDHEARLTRRGLEILSGVKGLRLLGPPTAEARVPIFSFTLEGCHPYDVAPLLDLRGIAVRTGQHCAQPLIESLGERTTIRASCSLYTTPDELDALAAGLEAVRTMLA